jgi:hypothetical protein
MLTGMTKLCRQLGHRVVCPPQFSGTTSVELQWGQMICSDMHAFSSELTRRNGLTGGRRMNTWRAADLEVHFPRSFTPGKVL